MGYLGDISLPPTHTLTPVELDSGHSALQSCCQPCLGDDRIMHLVLDWDGGTAQQLLIGYADDEDGYTSKDFSVTIDRPLWSMTTSAACSFSLSIIGGVHYLLAMFSTSGTPGGTSDYTFDSSVTGTPGGINGNVLFSSTDDGDTWSYLTTVKTCGPPAGLGQWVGINTEIAAVGSDWWACVSDPGSQNKVSGVYSTDSGATWHNTPSGIVNTGQRLLWGSRNWGSIGGAYFYSFGEDVISFQRAVGITTTDDHGASYHNDTYEEYLFGVAGMPTPPGDQGWQHTYANVGPADDTEVWRIYNSGQSVGVASTLIQTATISPAEWTVEEGALFAQGFSAPWVVLLDTKVAYLLNNLILGGVVGWMVGKTLYV